MRYTVYYGDCRESAVLDIGEDSYTEVVVGCNYSPENRINLVKELVPELHVEQISEDEAQLTNQSNWFNNNLAQLHAVLGILRGCDDGGDFYHWEYDHFLLRCLRELGITENHGYEGPTSLVLNKVPILEFNKVASKYVDILKEASYYPLRVSGLSLRQDHLDQLPTHSTCRNCGRSLELPQVIRRPDRGGLYEVEWTYENQSIAFRKACKRGQPFYCSFYPRISSPMEVDSISFSLKTALVLKKVLTNAVL
jgi:hypothetical protein